MEFCLDERGRIVQKVHYARRKVSAKPPASLKNPFPTCTPANEMDGSVDHSPDEAEDDFPLTPAGRVSIAATNSSIAKGGVPVPFPWRLHDMLDAMEQQGKDDIVTWQPHGLAFLVKDPKAFVEQIMPHYFSQSKVRLDESWICINPWPIMAHTMLHCYSSMHPFNVSSTFTGFHAWAMAGTRVRTIMDALSRGTVIWSGT
jgi:HSF-type DNA-binding